MSPESHLSSRLEQDITWRIKELSEVVRACHDTNGLRQTALLRASVPVIYAHWEGYFVHSINAYLTYVSELGVYLSQLKDEFWALNVRKRYNPNQVQGDAPFRDFLIGLRQEEDRLFERDSFDRITGKSNLRSNVIVHACQCIGINNNHFKEYFNFIDKELLDKRNHIAHGASMRFELDSLAVYRDKVVDLMRLVQQEIEHAVVHKAHLR